MQSAKYRLALNGVHSNHALTPSQAKQTTLCNNDLNLKKKSSLLNEEQ